MFGALRERSAYRSAHLVLIWLNGWHRLVFIIPASQYHASLIWVLVSRLPVQLSYDIFMVETTSGCLIRCRY